MNKTAKLAIGMVAFAAPITVGWMATASPSLLSGGLFADHTIDEFEMSGHWVFREDAGGTVTEVVTGPDGRVLAPDEIPDDIADALADWSPPEPTIDVNLNGDPACYVVVDDDLDRERVIGDTDGRGFALRGHTDSNGDVVVEAVVFDSSNDMGDDLAAYLDSGDPLADLPGATEIGECP